MVDADAGAAEEDQVVGAGFFPIGQNLPPAQAPTFGFNYAIRTNGDAAALAASVRNTIASLDRELAVADVTLPSHPVPLDEPHDL